MASVPHNMNGRPMKKKEKSEFDAAEKSPLPDSLGAEVHTGDFGCIRAPPSM